MTQDTSTHPVEQEPGRVEGLLRRSPFWFEVAHGVTSALTTAFIVAWIGSAIVLAALGDHGSDIRWDVALGWSVLFLLLGAAIACLGVIGFAAADFPADATRRRGMVVLAVAVAWLLALAGAAFVPESGTDVAAVVLVATLGLGVASSWVVMSWGRHPRADRPIEWTDTFWRVVNLVVGLTAALMATALIGLALAVVFRRATE